MRILLDTHVFLWVSASSRRLSEPLRQSIQDPRNEVYLSVVSLWEILIKHRIGKLPLPHPPAAYIPAVRERHRIASLPLDELSVMHLGNLAALHRDPFDRLLVCQAIQHGMTLATVDEAIRAYPVPTMSA